MKNRDIAIVWLAVGLIGLLATERSAVAQSPDAKGLIVINDGSTSVKFSTVGEWREFESFGQTYRAEMTDGRVLSGPKGVVLLWIDYKSRDAVQKLKQLGAAIPEWSDFAEAKSQELARPAPRPTPIGGGSSNTPVLDRLELNGTVYTGVKPTSISDGMIGLVHDKGALRLPADLLSHRSLERLGRIGPELRGSREYADLVGSFEPTVFAGGKMMSGVRLSRRDGDRVTLLTDEGEVTMNEDEFRDEMMKRVTEAGRRYEAWKRKLEEEENRRLEAARRQSELEFEREKARIERQTEAAKFWWSVGRGLVNQAFSSR